MPLLRPRDLRVSVGVLEITSQCDQIAVEEEAHYIVRGAIGGCGEEC